MQNKHVQYKKILWNVPYCVLLACINSLLIYFCLYNYPNNQIWDIIWRCVTFSNMSFHRVHSQHILVHHYSTRVLFHFLFKRYNIFNGSLKLIFNKRNTCLNFITNILSRPNISLKDIQIFHYFLRKMYLDILDSSFK